MAIAGIGTQAMKRLQRIAPVACALDLDAGSARMGIENAGTSPRPSRVEPGVSGPTLWRRVEYLRPAVRHFRASQGHGTAEVRTHTPITGYNPIMIGLREMSPLHDRCVNCCAYYRVRRSL
jgi:hypothetical protein